MKKLISIGNSKQNHNLARSNILNNKSFLYNNNNMMKEVKSLAKIKENLEARQTLCDEKQHYIDNYNRGQNYEGDLG